MRVPGFGKAADNLIKWSGREEWAPYLDLVFAEHFGPIREEYDLSEEEMAELLGGAFSMLYGCVLEDFFTSRFGDEGEKNIIDDYLKRRGWREKVPVRRYLEAMRDSVPSIYEVVALDPGRSVTVRDLVLGGDPITIGEKLGSQTMARWDRIAARVVTVNNKPYFTGGLLLLPYEVADDVLSDIEAAGKEIAEVAREEAKKQGETADFKDHDLRVLLLQESIGVIVQAWLIDALERALAPLPELRNTDGDAFLLSEARYPVLDDLAKIIAGLDDIDDIERDDDDGRQWTWYAPAPQFRETSQGKGLVIATQNDAGGTVLGSIEIADDTLVLSTNSDERAERGRALLMSRLGGLLGQPVTSRRTVEQALEEGSDSDLEPLEVPPDVAEQAISTFLDSHYRETLDHPVPYLDGKTPRQAARTEKGRGRAMSWLKRLENSEARRAAQSGQRPYDFQWMWGELGLADH